MMKRFFFILFLLFFSINKGFSWTIESISKESAQGKVHLVLCPLHYSQKEDFLSDISIILERLKRTKPFDEDIAALKIWRVNIIGEEEKRFFKEKSGFPPLGVRQDFLKGISNYLKSNYKLIIVDAKGGTSCAELSSKNKMSLIILGRARYRDRNSFAKGFLHELGHSLGLRDECIDCVQRCPPGPPNCATTKEEAVALWGDLVGKVERINYIRGCCGNKDYIRPTIASLMNDADKAEDFGLVNERFLREELRRE